MSVIVAVVAVLLQTAAPSPIWKPQFISADYGRNIRQLPCVSRRTGETGTCMFAYACMKANGTHLGTCIDRFYFGSCCRLEGDLLPSLAFQPVHEDDNSVIAQVSTDSVFSPYEPDLGSTRPTTYSPTTETPTTTTAKTTIITQNVITTSEKVSTTTTTNTKPATITTNKPTSSTPTTKKPATTSTKKPATSTTKKPITSTTKKPITSTTKKPITSTTKKPITSTTKKPITSTTKKPITSTTKKPTTSITKKPTTSTTKRPTVNTTTTKKPVTGRPTSKPKPSVPTTVSPPTKKPTGKPPGFKPTSPKPSYSNTAKPTTIVKPITKPAPSQKPPATSTTSVLEVTKPLLVTTSEKPQETTEKLSNVTLSADITSSVNDSNEVSEDSTVTPTSITPMTETTSGSSLVTWTLIENANLPQPTGTDESTISTTSDWVQVSLSTPHNDTTTTTTIPPGVDDFTGNLSTADYREVCGRRMVPDGRIVGGQVASFGKWPWQISLRQWRTSTYLHKCGAALLNENWAITAAHCVENVLPSDLLLRLGEHDLSTEDEPYGYQERRVQIVASHPQFDPRTFEYDLALLRFYEPVTFQPNIIPICVPRDGRSFVGQTAHVTGWGRLYEDGPLPSVLQEVSVPVINNTLCESMYRSAGYIEHIPEIFICAGWKKGGFDSCEGDSGGPMVIQREDGRWILAGVISWGIGCAEPNQPGVYTRISEFREWINQILQF